VKSDIGEQGMPAKKMRVEVYDETGNRYTVTFEGRVTRDKAIRLLDLVELLGGMPSSSSGWTQKGPELSKLDRVQLITEKHFPLVWFSSKDIQSVYEQEFKEPIQLSTISTYLSRMADRGILDRSGPLNQRRYRLMTDVTRLAKISH
jgi:hypothetical protein